MTTPNPHATAHTAGDNPRAPHATLTGASTTPPGSPVAAASGTGLDLLEPPPQPPPADPRLIRQGVILGLIAYGWWGLVPLYFRAVSVVDPLEVLAHRVAWSVLPLLLLVALRRRLAELIRALKRRETWRAVVPSTALIAVNWFVFIYAVDQQRLSEASLGYYINPLVNVTLGMVFLGERLRPRQWLAVAVASLGVAVMTIDLGKVPWISLTLAVSFGLYALVRKRAPVDSLLGLTIETTLLLPLAAAYLAVLTASGAGALLGDQGPRGYLVLAAGIVTAVPLLAFAAAARRLTLSSIGLMQYLSPTLQFLLAVLAFGEPLGAARAAAFGLIWTALAIYTLDALSRRARARTPGPGDRRA